MGNHLCFHVDGRPVCGAAQGAGGEPLDQGQGVCFVYVGPDVPELALSGSNASTSSLVLHSDEGAGATSGTPLVRSISGAALSANPATPLSTTPAPLFLCSELACCSSASFESSSSFASVPLQPRHYGSFSGPIGSDRHHFNSGPIERASHSGPIEHHRSSGIFSGPLDRPTSSSSSGPFYPSLSKRIAIRRAAHHRPAAPALFRRVTRYLSQTATKFSCLAATAAKPSEEPNAVKAHSFPAYLDSATDPSSNSTTIHSSGNDNINFNSIGDESDSSEAAKATFHWAHGKAGEDRVHVIVSEEHGWVFVGIYDGFNGPDATDYLLANLYPSIQRELRGLLWDDKPSKGTPKEFDAGNQTERSQEQPSGTAASLRAVLRALARALRKTEDAYLQIVDKAAATNPELALMGSCVLVLLMRGENAYLMNVGDSRAVLAKRAEPDLWNLVGKATQEPEAIRRETLRYLESFDGGDLVALQLTLDHSTCNDEELRRIRREHPDDPAAIANGRVKGSLRITRAFGAGYLKQPKWNDVLLGAFRIDYKGTSPYITCNPFLCYHRIGSKDKYLILSSDGLYQYFTNEEVVAQVEMFLATNPDNDPSQFLVQEVLYRAADRAGMEFKQLLDVPQGDRRKYHDDVSVVIISLEGRMWQSSL